MVVHEIVRSQLFYIDTAQRSGGTIGAPQFSFPNNLVQVKPQESEEIKLTLQEMTIEATFYQVEEYNNKVVVREGPIGTLVERCVEVPIGNYTVPTFVQALQDALNTGAPANTSYILTYNAQTGLIRYFCTSSEASITFIFDNDVVSQANNPCPPIQESLNESMGFARNAVVPFTRIPPAITPNEFEAFSTIPITMSPGVSNLYVTIDNQCSNYGNTDVPNTFTPSNILAKVPISSGPQSTIFFYDINGNYSSLISNTYLDNLNIELVNERFTRIEPRKNWTATIKIDIIRTRAEVDMKQHMQEMLELERLRFFNDSQRN
jgi:hypothetical protein